MLMKSDGLKKDVSTTEILEKFKESGKPLVSVCLPVYNGISSIDETIISIQEQDVTDIEIVAVDDGSTDGSLERLQELARQDSRIRVFSQENSGSCVSPRNEAFRLAKGTFITTVDADDLWPQNKLKLQLGRLYDNPDAIVIGGVKRFSGDGDEREWSFDTIPFDWDSPQDYLENLLELPNDEKVLINTLCCKSHILKEDKWDPKFHTGHDWEAWIRLAKKYDFIHLDEILQYYRKHASSSTAKNKLTVVAQAQTAVIETHGKSIVGRSKTEAIKSRIALEFFNHSVYYRDVKSALLLIIKASNDVRSFFDPRFYKSIYRAIKECF